MANDDLLDRVTVDPAVCHGQPCIRGTRVPITVILDALAAGMTVEEIIIGHYPTLTADDVLAVMQFRRQM